MAIKRDQYGIIVQHPDMDGGDSLSRTAIMALCGSEQDRKLMNLFEKDHLFVRHPYQDDFDDTWKASRDQVSCAASTGLNPGVIHQYAEGGFVNQDVLSPFTRLAYYHAINQRAPLWVRILGPLSFRFELYWNTKVEPDDEQNQFACLCISMGQWHCEQLIKNHPSIEKNIIDYFSGWRDQIEIGQQLVKKLFETAKGETNGKIKIENQEVRTTTAIAA